jgi:hypothetical protein
MKIRARRLLKIRATHYFLLPITEVLSHHHAALPAFGKLARKPFSVKHAAAAPPSSVMNSRR